MNGFKTETMKKHYKANRTLRIRITKGILETRINTGFSQEKVLFDSKMITLAEKYLFTFRWRLLGESQLKLIEKVLLNWRENQFGKTFLLAYVN